MSNNWTSYSELVQTGRGRPRTLSTDAVTAAALAALDEGGAAALSVRGVATRLGVAPNAVYTYVAGRADLERALVERVLGEADVALLGGRPGEWRVRVRRYAVALREVLLTHPGAVPLFMTAPMDGPTALRVGEGLLAALTDGGADLTAASRGAYAVIVHVLGSTALEVAETDGRPPLPPEEERVAGRRARLGALPAEGFPLTAATAGTAASWIGAEQFGWGLDRLLDGIAGR